MRVFIFIGFINAAALAIDTGGYNYNNNALLNSLSGIDATLSAITALPQNENIASNYPPPRGTNFFTFSAPNNLQDTQDFQRWAAILRSQRVVFIKSPETNIFTMTAEQLSKRNPIDIYVLNRQTNAESLTEQLREIQAQHTQKPNVYFVKYRTPEEAERAQTTIKADYESAIPGPSSHNTVGLAALIDLKKNMQKPASEKPSIIFKIALRHSNGYKTYEAVDDIETPI